MKEEIYEREEKIKINFGYYDVFGHNLSFLSLNTLLEKLEFN